MIGLLGTAGGAVVVVVIGGAGTVGSVPEPPMAFRWSQEGPALWPTFDCGARRGKAQDESL